MVATEDAVADYDDAEDLFPFLWRLAVRAEALTDVWLIELGVMFLLGTVWVGVAVVAEVSRDRLHCPCEDGIEDYQ